MTITLTGVDDLPEAVDDTATVGEDDPATAIDVLGNDTDIDAGPKRLPQPATPANGTVVLTGHTGAHTGLDRHQSTTATIHRDIDLRFHPHPDAG
ncbi:MAG: Ig-like domain-containing protein [Candidatus Competibacteraceae bacterium]